MNSKHLGSISHTGTLYIDDVFSINNPDFGNYFRQLYSAELCTGNHREYHSVSYLDLLLSIEGMVNVTRPLTTNFHITMVRS